MRYTVIILFIIVTFDTINCASDVNKDDTVTGNYFLELKSRTKRWIDETIKTPSGALDSISSPKVRRANCGKWAKMIYLDKNGKMGSKEYALVFDAIEKSKGSGCFKIFKIRKVKNGCLWKDYESRREDVMIESNATDANERLLFYGTDDVWQIIRKGFDERLATGGASGAGIYFTDQFSVADTKAVETACPSCLRKMLLSRVILGKQYKQSASDKRTKVLAHAPVGHHSVLGTQFGAAHDYVVYRGEQAYPEFVISYKIC